MEPDKLIDEKTSNDESLDPQKSLVLHNDDYHTFDYVINALIEICEMDIIQATQCTYLVHYKDKCEVRKGSKNKLLPMRRGLAERNLKAIIV